VINRPAFHAKKLGDFTIAIATILLGQPDQGQAQFVIILGCRLIAQCTPRQADHFAGSSLRRIELLTNMDYSLT
jgi:hypothetical protein